MADIITQGYLASVLADSQLSANQQAMLPGATTAASRAIRRHCNRFFNRQSYDGLYTLDWPSRTLLLRQYPIDAPPRVRTNPTVVLSVWNTSTANQEATVTLATDGTDEDIDDLSPATTGLVLYSVASAVATTRTLTWVSYPTLTALAAAVVALGNGWQATVASGYELRASANFRAGQGAQPGLGFQSQVGLAQHVDDVPCLYDARRGTITLSAQDNDPFTSPRFGIYLQTDLDDVQVYGGLQGVRVTYSAGWTTVPEDVQDACAETVYDWIVKKTLDQNLGSESDGARSIVINTAFANYGLPKSVLGKLAPYRSPRA